jgi:hypothetical protein
LTQMVQRIIALASLMATLLSMTYVPAVAAVSSATPNAVSSTTVTLPAGKYSKLYLLGSGVNGNQANQLFAVNYTDGTTTKITQSLSDWWGGPQNFPGESAALQMPSLISPTGATLRHAVYVYGYTFAIDGARTVKSITLPNNRNVAVLAIDVSGSGATRVRVNLAAADNVIGIIPNDTAPAKGGWDNDGYAYSAGLIGSSITWAGSTFALGTSTVAQTLQISGSPATTAEVGQYYSFSPTVIASAGSTLTYAVGNKPSWAQFSATTGTLSGTPATAGATDANILVSVDNGAQSAALSAFNISVKSAPAMVGSATLSWSAPTKNTDGSPLTNLAGFVVRYGTSSTALNSKISVASASATGVEISSLSPGNWVFAVSAINAANVESQLSTIVGKKI